MGAGKSVSPEAGYVMPDGKTRIARTGTDSHKFKPSRFAKASVFAKATPDETPDRSEDRSVFAKAMPDGHRFLNRREQS
jgi:hypothetical protein